MDMGVPQIRDEYSFFKRLSQSPNIKDSEAFQYEYRRLASFANWPEGSEIDLFHTAKAGFYYEGVENRLRCFSCGVTFNATTEDPVNIHNSKNPSCPLFSHTDTLNKPLWVSDDEGSDVEDSISELDDEYNAVASTSTSVLGDTPASYPSDLPDLTQATTISRNTSSQPEQTQSPVVENVHSTVVSPTHDSDPEVTQAASGEFTRRSVSPRAVSLPANAPSVLRDQDTVSSANSDTPSVACGLDEQRPASSEEPSRTLNMFSEEVRLRTFAQWPASAKVRAADLARLGFFYMGTQDKTQCAFCHRVLMKWEEGDDIQTEHRKYTERDACPFLAGTETRNIPILAQRTHTTVAQSHAGREGPQAMQRSQGAVTLTRRPMNSEDQGARAMHPEHTDYSQRLASFLQNPEWRSTNVSAQSLAAAGFYFAGFGDNVRCHFCDGGLRNWEKDDDPWVEHARWFKRCGYLLTKKGASFIEEVTARYPVARATPEQVQEAVEQPDPLHDLPLNVKFRKEAREMGFMDDQIREAVEKEQATKGHTFLDMLSLVHALLALIPEGAEQATAGPCTHNHAVSPGNTREKEEADKERASSGKSKKNKKKKKKGSANGESNQQNAPVNTPTTVLIPEDDDESRSLQEENRQLKEQRMCKVCMDEEVNIVFLPCGHLVACANCAPALRACPICRALIRGSLRTYLS